MTIPERIKQCRKAQKMTQEKLAELVGMSIMTIRRWEWGEQTPNASVLPKLADALHTTVSYLMGEEPDTEPPLPPSNARVSDRDVVWIPVVSNTVKVCCGDGNSYPEDIEWEEIGRYPILTTDVLGYAWQMKDGGYHIIAVEGDSMEPMIPDGSRILIVDVEILDGDLAVCLYRGRTMLRGIAFEKNGVRLIPWNKQYPEIYVPKDSEELYFLGKMLGIIGGFRKLSSMR